MAIYYLLQEILRGVIYLTYALALLSLLIAKLWMPKMLQYGKYNIQSNKTRNMGNIIDWFYELKVPHEFFSHIYVLSTALAAFNVYFFHRYLIVWLVLLHSLRRLAESIKITNWGEKSKIHITHYLVGIWFYFFLNISIMLQLLKAYETFTVKSSSLITLIAVVSFALASYDQLQNHIHLSKLQKYSLPTRGLFKLVACAHYLDELIIYISLALADRNTNIALLQSVIWVATCLSISAINTKKYYDVKFHNFKRPNYAFIPYVI